MAEQAFDLQRETPRALEHVVATDFEGGEGVLVDLNTKQYYQLNETAMLVWRGLERGLSLAELAEQMSSGYDVTPEHARRSVEKILNNLLALKLVGRG